MSILLSRRHVRSLHGSTGNVGSSMSAQPLLPTDSDHGEYQFQRPPSPVSFFFLSCLVSVFPTNTPSLTNIDTSGHARLLVLRLDDIVLGRPSLHLLLGLPRPHWLPSPRLRQHRHGLSILRTQTLLTHGVHSRTNG